MKSPEQRFEWAMEVCVQARMRLTPTREKILAFLATQSTPVNLEAVMAQGIRDSCDATTAYRTLMLLQELEVIRQVSLPNKINYFVLNIPGESGHFLICRCCGEISALPASESVAGLEREAASVQGYARLYHELVLFGVCRECQKHPPSVRCAKIQPRMRSATRLKFGISNLL